MVVLGVVHGLAELCVHSTTEIKVLRNSTAALKNLAQFADSRAQMLSADEKSSMSAVAALIRLCNSSSDLSLGANLGDMGGVDPTGGRDPTAVAQVLVTRDADSQL
jgi:hypothetical protein